TKTNGSKRCLGKTIFYPPMVATACRRTAQEHALYRNGCSLQRCTPAAGSPLSTSFSLSVRRYLSKQALISDAAVSKEAAVHRHDDAGDKAGGVTRQPDRRAHQFLRLTKAAHGRVVDDRLAALRQRVVGVEQKIAVLFADKKAGRDGVDAQPRPVLERQFHGQPAGEIVDRRLGRGIPNHARQRALGSHRRKADGAAA